MVNGSEPEISGVPNYGDTKVKNDSTKRLPRTLKQDVGLFVHRERPYVQRHHKCTHWVQVAMYDFVYVQVGKSVGDVF
jgi:hypothetical protein